MIQRRGHKMRYLNALSFAGALICAVADPLAAQRPMNIGAVTTWHVDDDTCPAPGSGTEADPFCLIQDCIDTAMDGDECVVAPGTYFEAINFLGKAITVRSSDGAGVTIIDATNSGQVSVVECSNKEGPGTILDGFTLTGGTGTDLDGVHPTTGGGMRNRDSSPTVSNCTFAGNSADFGGGMFNGGSSPTVSNCTFSENTANSSGGGMDNLRSDPTVTNCTFSGNRAILYSGGGMSNVVSSPMVTNCTFSGNAATGVRGGGMFNAVSSRPTVTNCRFSGNTANSSGGGMYNGTSSIVTVTNCTFSGNDADNGRALAFDSPQLFPSDLSMTNCILWDGGDEVWNNDNSIINITDSDVQKGWPGAGNIDSDPLFVDFGFWDDNGTSFYPGDDFWVEGDYHFLPGSPCIDAGDNTAVPGGIVTDLDGNPRFVDDPNTDDTGFGDPPIVDMGAYEFRDPCADDDGDGRVTICHVPPGNPENARTITVSIHAVPAHLAHGDYCGPCGNER